LRALCVCVHGATTREKRSFLQGPVCVLRSVPKTDVNSVQDVNLGTACGVEVLR